MWFIFLFQSRQAILGVRYVNNALGIDTFHFLLYIYTYIYSRVKYFVG